MTHISQLLKTNKVLLRVTLKNSFAIAAEAI